MAIALHPVTKHHWKESGSILLAPDFEILKCTDEIPSEYWELLCYISRLSTNWFHKPTIDAKILI